MALSLVFLLQMRKKIKRIAFVSDLQVPFYNEAIVKLNSDIIVENTRKNKLNDNLKQILGTKNGAAEMFDNTSDTYKTQYVSNIMIIIGVFLLLWMLFKVFKTPTAVIQQQY